MSFIAIATSLLLSTAQLSGVDIKEASETTNAQSQGASEEIVVEGTKSEVRNELRTILQETSDQLARYEGEFCPVVMGLGEDLTPRFKSLLIENAASVGLETGEKGCDATALVIFIDTPQELALALRKKYHRMFGNMSPYRRDRLLEPERSHYTWQVYRTLDRDGTTPAAAMSAGQDGTDVPTVRARATRIGLPTSKDIGMSFIIIDVNAIEGATLGQLADFTSLNLMLPVQYDAYEDARADSMLRLLEVDDKRTMPARMNAFDKRLLSGLYSFRNNSMRAIEQRGRLASYIKEGEAKGNEEEGRGQ